MGNKLTEFVPYGVFDIADDPVAVVVATDEQWQDLCAVLDRPDLATDERFATVTARRDHRAALESTLQSEFGARPRAEWVERAQAEQVPVAPIYDTAEVWADEHVRSRGVRDSVDVDGGAVDVLNYPVRFERMDSEITRGPPVLGADTRDALEAAGYTDDEIEAFRDAIERYDAGAGD
jgi:crotonobetainyl-CoA:carnitine CoA-transferase CaiB-like acyl-CoA transferase